MRSSPWFLWNNKIQFKQADIRKNSKQTNNNSAEKKKKSRPMLVLLNALLPALPTVMNLERIKGVWP